MPIRALSNSLQRKAKNELNEVPDRVPEDLQHLKDWLCKQPHLKARIDDQWLLAFLRGCKFSLQKTKEKLDCFYTMRTLVPEFFRERDPLSPEIQDALSRRLVIILPKTAVPDGPRIFIIRAGALDPDKLDLATVIKAGIMTADILMNEDDSCVISGQLVLLDLQDLPYKYVKQITPSVVKKMVVCLQNAYPSRLKGFYLINAPQFMTTIYGMMKGLVRGKLANKLKIYKNFDKIYNTLPHSILPIEYGGEGDTLDKLAAQWKVKVESYRNWFLEDTEYCSDEAKRPGKAKTSADTFGIEGSFRRLSID